MNWILFLLGVSLPKETLTDITKPYLTTYTCERMVMGRENLLDEFERVTIELKEDGYIYRFETLEGKMERKGKYIYDETEHTIVLDGMRGELKDGLLTFGKQIGEQYFFARFVG